MSNQPLVGAAAAPAGSGYWLVAADGGIFSFDAPFHGSRGGQAGADRFFALVVTGGGTGYLIAGSHPAT